MEASLEVPLCPEHPEQRSIAACERCGRFLCQSCLVSKEPPRCAPCAARVTDPLGILAVPFSIQGALSHGWQLFRHAFPGILLVSLLFSVPGGLLTYVSATEGYSQHLSTVYDVTLGLMGVGACLALMVGAAEGGQRGLGHALAEGLRAWPRLFSARFRSGLSIFFFALALIIPGIMKAVSLAVTTEAAYREPRRDALESSSTLTERRMWEVFWVCVICKVPLYGLVYGLSFLFGLLLEVLPALWPVLEIVVDLVSRMGEILGIGIGLGMFYGLKRFREWPLAPR
jgi:hypothetical protein